MAEGKTKIRSFYVLHIKPNRVPSAALRLTHTFGLGGSALVLFVLLAATGLMLTLVYKSTPAEAYESVAGLGRDYRFGQFVRNVHYLGANLLAAVSLLHLLRVFYTGGYHGPRRLNWVFGVLLLLLVLAANFTGYLLPWDQLSYWAVTICTAMLGYVPLVGQSLQTIVRGGQQLGHSTLVLFHAFHTTLIPMALLILMGFHFWRVRKAKGVVVPTSAKDEKENESSELEPVMPSLLLRELSLGLFVVALVFVLALFYDAPLGERANPGMSPNPAKAPWYFIGFQELQIHFHPVLAVVAAPLLALGAILVLPYLRFRAELAGAWFLTDRGRRSTVIAALTSIIVTFALVIADHYLLEKLARLPGEIGRGLLPPFYLVGFGLLVTTVLKRRLGFSRAERIQVLFTGLMAALLVLTLVGMFLRGPGMKLIGL